MLVTKWFYFNFCSVCLIRTNACQNREREPSCFCMKQIRRWWYLRFSEKCKTVGIDLEVSSKNLIKLHDNLQVKMLWMVLRIIIITNLIFALKLNLCICWIFLSYFRRNFSKDLLPSSIKPLELLWMAYSILRALNPFTFLFFVGYLRVASCYWYGRRRNYEKLGKLYMVFESTKCYLHFKSAFDWQKKPCAFLVTFNLEKFKILFDNSIKRIRARTFLGLTYLQHWSATTWLQKYVLLWSWQIW